MKALTICQPWADLIVSGRKCVENRTWYTAYRGPLFIHAGKSRQWFAGWDGALMQDGLPEPSADVVPFGAIVGRCVLSDCVRPNARIVVSHPFTEGPWCWLLTDIERFAEPIPYRGAQGLFDIPADIATPSGSGVGK